MKRRYIVVPEKTGIKFCGETFVIPSGKLFAEDLDKLFGAVLKERGVTADDLLVHAASLRTATFDRGEQVGPFVAPIELGYDVIEVAADDEV